MIAIALCLVGLVVYANNRPVAAQAENGWPEPFQLSQGDHTASEAALVSDDFGFVHMFWAEVLPDTRSLLQYSRYDGSAWTTPVDLRLSPPLISQKSISPFYDGKGTLHAAWTIGDTGPAFYTRAPVDGALSARNWQDLRTIQVPASAVQLVVSEDGTLHALYQVVTPTPARPGVYAVRSEDGGLTWSDPVWLDPDIPEGYIPRTIQFAVDAEGTLHATWFYISSMGGGGDWVRYARSADGGATWSRPMTMAKNSEGDAPLNQSAMPVMAVRGKEVHIMWAAGEFLNRQHRYSSDGGLTWSRTEQLFGTLNGQAFDSLAFDGAGRLHFLAQIRFPQAIYHAYWSDGQWSRIEPIYAIRADDTLEIPDYVVHAHHVHAAFRAGNELVVAFNDPPPEPNRRLFVMTRILPGLAPLVARPLPTATPAPTSTPTPAPATATPVPTVPVFENADNAGLALGNAAFSPSSAVLLALLTVTLLVGATVAFRFVAGNRRQ